VYEINGSWSETRTKHIKAFCGKKVCLFNGKPDGMCRNTWFWNVKG